MILFAAAIGLRPGEWIALGRRDLVRKERVAYVRRSFTRGELKIPKRRRRACERCRCNPRPAPSMHSIG